MRTKIIIFFILSTIITSISGEEKAPLKVSLSEPGMLTPSRASVFIEISNLENAENTLNIFSKYIDTPGYLDNIIKFISFLKEKINKDILKNEFLKTSGMDTGKSMFMTYIQDDNIQNKIIFIPVLDEKEFPLFFIKILKSMKKNAELDLNPAVTPYKEFKISQILKDIFYTTIDGYFILVSSGELLKEIIDIKTSPAPASLSAEPVFSGYHSKKDSLYPVNIFIRGKSISTFNFKELTRENFDDAGEKMTGGEEAKSAKENKPESKPEKSAPVKRSTRYDFMEYIGLGLRSVLDKLDLKLNVAIDKNWKYSNSLFATFLTGYADKTIYIPDPIAYGFLSADLKSLSDSFDKPENKNNILLPLLYGKLNYYLKSNLGIDMRSEFTPYFGNLLNVIFTKSQKRKRFDNYIIYFPIVNCEDNKVLYQKISSSVKKKYDKPGAFGETRVEGIDSFWFADRMGNKNYFFIYDNKFFMINDIDLIKYFKQEGGKNLFDVNKEFKNYVNKDTFLFLHVKFDKDTLTKMMIGMMLISIDPGLAPLIDKMDTLAFSGNKIENLFNFNINISLLPDNK